MFGVVPKPLWEAHSGGRAKPHPLAMRCLLIEHPEGLILVDTGLGTRKTPSSTTSTASECGPRGPQLEDALA